MSAERKAARLVVVTGMSGAGKSTALRALDDLGYYCVDNLPPALAYSTVLMCAEGGIERVALGMDVRVGSFIDAAQEAVKALTHHPGGLEVLYLDATDDALVRRYSETRRPHPLLARQATDSGLGVADGVRLERRRLGALRHLATAVLDTSHMTVHDLRRQVQARYSEVNPSEHLLVRMVSFGFKHGLPLDASLVFDVRFLDNPYFDPALKDLDGNDAAVRDFVLSSPGCAEILDHLESLLRFVLPRYQHEGKSYVTVAIGCTGGRHRSVVVAHELARRLAKGSDPRVGIVHRDVARGVMMAEVAQEGGAGPAGQSTTPAARTLGHGERGQGEDALAKEERD